MQIILNQLKIVPSAPYVSRFILDPYAKLMLNTLDIKEYNSRLILYEWVGMIYLNLLENYAIKGYNYL